MGNKSPAQIFGLVFGVVYLVVGLVGFAVTGFDNFAADTNEKLIVFQINPLHNIAHLGVGALLLVGSRTHDAAKATNLIVGVTYLLLGLLGLPNVVIDELLNNNTADTFLHLGTAALALYFGTVGASQRSGAARTV